MVDGNVNISNPKMASENEIIGKIPGYVPKNQVGGIKLDEEQMKIVENVRPAATKSRADKVLSFFRKRQESCEDVTFSSVLGNELKILKNEPKNPRPWLTKKMEISSPTYIKDDTNIIGIEGYIPRYT